MLKIVIKIWGFRLLPRPHVASKLPIFGNFSSTYNGEYIGTKRARNKRTNGTQTVNCTASLAASNVVNFGP